MRCVAYLVPLQVVLHRQLRPLPPHHLRGAERLEHRALQQRAELHERLRVGRGEEGRGLLRPRVRGAVEGRGHGGQVPGQLPLRAQRGVGRVAPVHVLGHDHAGAQGISLELLCLGFWIQVQVQGRGSVSVSQSYDSPFVFYSAERRQTYQQPLQNNPRTAPRWLSRRMVLAAS